MSHVTDAAVKITSLDDAEAAAQRLGGKLVRGQRTMRWWGNFVDDSSTWTTMFAPDEVARIAKLPSNERKAIITNAMSSCDHVVSFPGASYDVGLVRQPDGTFRLRWDTYGTGGLSRYMGKDGGRFAQAYGVEAAKRQARMLGYHVNKETPRTDGTVELELLVR